jgi:hypothetical protein
MLLNLSKGNEISSIFITLTDEELVDKRRVVVYYKTDYHQFLKLEGKLMCVSDIGIFVYSKNILTYIPYKLIKSIKRGINFGNQIGIAVAAGGGIGFIYGLTDSNWPIVMGIVYGLYGAAFGGFYYLVIGGPIHFLATASKKFNFKIKYKEENGKLYLKMIIENCKIYGNRMQIKDYPSKTPQIETNSNVPQKQKDTIAAAPVKITPTPLKVEFPKLNTPSGKINPQWMYFSFNKLDVNEKKLMAKFKNIQGSQMIAENLQNLNPSEIQYLAISIATLNGYNFRNIVSFTESQNLNLKNYESYISYEVKSDSEIDPTNLQELDLNNINLMYSVLKEKNN